MTVEEDQSDNKIEIGGIRTTHCRQWCTGVEEQLASDRITLCACRVMAFSSAICYVYTKVRGAGVQQAKNKKMLNARKYWHLE